MRELRLKLPASQPRGVGVEGGEVGGGWRWGHKLVWVRRPWLLFRLLHGGPWLLLWTRRTPRCEDTLFTLRGSALI